MTALALPVSVDAERLAVRSLASPIAERAAATFGRGGTSTAGVPQGIDHRDGVLPASGKVTVSGALTGILGERRRGQRDDLLRRRGDARAATGSLEDQLFHRDPQGAADVGDREELRRRASSGLDLPERLHRDVSASGDLDHREGSPRLSQSCPQQSSAFDLFGSQRHPHHDGNGNTGIVIPARSGGQRGHAP